MSGLLRLTFGLACCLLSMHFGYAQEACPTHSGCLTCDQDDGTCTMCKHGFWDDKCDADCGRCEEPQVGDVFCDKTDGACTSGMCVPGMAGLTCTLVCPEGCRDVNGTNICDYATSSCADGCDVTLYGDHCQHQCSKNCLHSDCVDNVNNCVQGCAFGTYGFPTCGLMCSQNCVDEACDYNSGNCTYGCVNNYFGDKCDQECDKTCINGACDRARGDCLECIQATSNPDYFCREADCPAGLWGQQCDQACTSDVCLFDNCSRYDDECKGCDVGEWGLQCEKTCDQCKMDTGCAQMNGSCDQGCRDGYWGSLCDHSCDSECGTCDRRTGDCLVCIANRWGTTCGDECSSNCYPTVQAGQSNVYCEKDTGYCDPWSCKPGYWGQSCKQTCPDNCRPSSSGYKVCTNDNGYCLDGCQLTYYGDKCQNLCSANCRNRDCVDKANMCRDDCADSYYGLNCMDMCSLHCINPGNCSTNDGTCVGGCENEYYGSLCKTECISTCSNGKCDELGTCADCRVFPIGRLCRVQECDPGFYGNLCEETCPGAYCLDNKCARHTGECENGCLLNYYVPYCTSQCQCDQAGTAECSQSSGECVCNTGRRGILCDGYCSSGCKDLTCERTGVCTHGCTVGRWGSSCTSVCTQTCTNDECDPTYGNCHDCLTTPQGSGCRVAGDGSQTSSVLVPVVVCVVCVVVVFGIIGGICCQSPYEVPDTSRYDELAP